MLAIKYGLRSIIRSHSIFSPFTTITTLPTGQSAANAWQKSCYYKINFTISENAAVFDAVQRFSAFNIGALITVDSDKKISGVITERDYVNKIALLGRNSKETFCKEIATASPNLITAQISDSVDTCMEKMLLSDIRHLPLLDGDECVGLVSVKDLVKEVLRENR